MLEATCPVCGKNENKPWGSKNGFNMVKCANCGLIYVSPMPKETATIYDESYFTGGDGHGYVDYDRDKEPMRRAFELYLEHIEKMLGRKGSLLDVGAATGYFMDIAKSRGWEVEGVEISEHAASIGRAKGLHIRTGVLLEATLLGKRFDVVTLFDVAEHLSEPETTLLAAKSALKDGGLLVVTTPDAGSVWARVLGPKWHLVVPPEHLVLFSRKNFAYLLDRLGFKEVMTTTIGKHFTLPYIFQTLYHWQGFSIWNLLAKTTDKGPLSRLKIPINLHDTFFMIAKKIDQKIYKTQ